MTEIREINLIDELRDYRAVWRSLLIQTPWANFFHSLEWLETYWAHHGADKELCVFVVSRAGEPVGILPLVVLTERSKVGPLRVLTYPLHNWGSFYGPIGPDPGYILDAGLQYIRSRPRDWDVLELRWSGAAASDLQQTPSAMRRAGFQAYRTIWDRTAVIDLNDTWDAYLADRGSKWRNNVRRWERKLARRGTIQYLRYRPAGETHGEADPRWDLYDACEELSRHSWQGRSTTGTTLCHDSIRPFLRDVHAMAARLGTVDVNLLLLDDRPLAFAYNYHFGGAVYGLRIGYDAELSRDGAGNVLYLRAIQDSYERGDHFYDMGPGSLKIKQQFVTRVLPIYRYSHYPITVPRTQVLRLKRWSEQHAIVEDTVEPQGMTPNPV